jgi:hypothetical protein
MFFTLKSSILVISGYLRTVQVAPGHPVMPCESLGKSLQTCLSQDKSGFPDAKRLLEYKWVLKDDRLKSMSLTSLVHVSSALLQVVGGFSIIDINKFRMQIIMVDLIRSANPLKKENENQQ